MQDIQKFLEHKAYNMRVSSLIQPAQASSGHPTTCLSAADIAAVLFFYAMRYNPRNFHDPNNDRFILSKGHASALLYAAWKEVGVLTEKDLLTYRRIDSPLEGHPTFRFDHTEAATGSLGIGLSIGAGMALAAKLDKRDYYTYVLLGDGETSEGSVWEAVQLAAHYKLDNLIGIIDCNRLGQSDQTMIGHDTKRFEAMFAAFGWQPLVVDGHDVTALMQILDEARTINQKPVMIIAKTIKGYGVDIVEDKQGFHGKALKKDDLQQALAQLKQRFPDAATYKSDFVWQPQLPEKPQGPVAHTCKSAAISMPKPTYQKDDMIPTRKAYGQALAALGDVCDSVVSLDGEVKNSTYAYLFEDKHPNRFFQCFIAEQNMLSMGVGMDLREKMPFISTFACFFTRAHDQIRMAAIGESKIKLVGSHCGVSIGQDGPSQMGLEDLAMMRALPESIVLYPCDAVSTHKLVEQMARYDKGISYLRTTRAATPVIYDNDEDFPIGGLKVLHHGDYDQVCIVTAGITVFEALKAYDYLALQEKAIYICVVDLYSIKPIDQKALIKIVKTSDNKVITVEDHYPEGGLGEAVRSALSNTSAVVKSLAVNQLPRSGKPEELMALVGIDADAIVKKVQGMV